MTWISNALKVCNVFSCYRKIEGLQSSKEKLTEKVVKGRRFFLTASLYLRLRAGNFDIQNHLFVPNYLIDKH